jgi:hypothetical protein
MSEVNETQDESQDELASLKAKADLLGLSYHPSIGAEKLRAKIQAHLADEPEGADTENADAEKTPDTAVVEETLSQRRLRMHNEASELVRIRVTCLNPAKNEWEGEIFTAGNAVVGTFTKYVPFNNDEGWHVPRIIYNQIADRQCQIFVTQKGKNGINPRVGKLIKEFAVEVMPPLTKAELDELARRQAARHAVD